MQTLHDAVVGAELVSPWEFWRIPPGQVWWLIAARLDQKKPKIQFTQADRAEVLAYVAEERRQKEAAENADT